MPISSIRLVLDRGERQLWVGVPRRGIALRAEDLFVIPFSLLWAGFVTFGEVSAIRDGIVGMQLWLVPFMLVGLYITVGRFIHDAIRRAHTTYAVTSERVLIEVTPLGPFASRTTSLPLSKLAEITLHERRDGSGTITFGPADIPASRSRRYTPPQFEFIPAARLVYDLIREVQRAE